MPGRDRRPPAGRPEPPRPLPPGRVVHLPGRGELFVRDSGGTGTPVLLLHGWTVAADLNWHRAYQPLVAAGYRVLALDHRGHGRGLRTHAPFRLVDCAHDAAALVEHLEVGPVVAVGYSMGGPIASLLAREHPAVVRGLVLCATATDWQEPQLRLFWRTMGAMRLILSMFPLETWRWALRRWGAPEGVEATWMAAELSRGSGRDIAEAGRELGRYDARSWITGLRAPAAVVLTGRDRSVPPRKQRALATALDAPIFAVQADHFAVTEAATEFNHALLGALSAVLAAPEQRTAIEQHPARAPTG